MFQPKRIKSHERIPFALTKHERVLLLDLTLLGPDIEKRLRLATTNGARLVVGLTFDEVDELAGSVAADANHCDDAKTRRALDAVYDRLAKVEGEYTDEESEASVTATRHAQVRRSYTSKQGQYLAFIYYYSKIHSVGPAEADFQKYFRVSAPAVHQMILTLEAQGLIGRTPGQARSIRLRLSRMELPDLE